VAERADYRCEYSLIHEHDAGFSHQVDHIVSRKHGGASIEDNLAYACVLCNRNKGSDIASTHPETGKILRLYHPRRDRWKDHFRLNGGIVEPLTELGAVTLQLLRMNALERIAERRILQSLRSYPIL
jgi:HNH endonuclease